MKLSLFSRKTTVATSDTRLIAAAAPIYGAILMRNASRTQEGCAVEAIKAAKILLAELDKPV